eukprot:scaffold2570_cov436-Prasinococcus_capsulatus_cf.AAC.2
MDCRPGSLERLGTVRQASRHDGREAGSTGGSPERRHWLEGGEMWARPPAARLMEAIGGCGLARAAAAAAAAAGGCSARGDSPAGASIGSTAPACLGSSSSSIIIIIMMMLFFHHVHLYAHVLGPARLCGRCDPLP